MPTPQSQSSEHPSEDIEADPNVFPTGRRGTSLHRTPDRLAVTSQLHPFWGTKKGIGVIFLIVLVIVGGIVGGVIGAKGAGGLGGQASAGTTSIPSTSGPTSTTRSGTSSPPSNAILSSSTITPTIIPRAIRVSAKFVEAAF